MPAPQTPTGRTPKFLFFLLFIKERLYAFKLFSLSMSFHGNKFLSVKYVKLKFTKKETLLLRVTRHNFG